MCFCSLLVVGEHHVANANVEEQNEHSQDVFRLHLLAALNDEIVRVLVKPAPPEGHGSNFCHVKGQKGEILQHAISISLEC